MKVEEVYKNYDVNWIKTVVYGGHTYDYYDVLNNTYHSRSKQLSYERNLVLIKDLKYLLQALDMIEILGYDEFISELDNMNFKDKINLKRIGEMINES